MTCVFKECKHICLHMYGKDTLNLTEDTSGEWGVGRVREKRNKGFCTLNYFEV